MLSAAACNRGANPYGGAPVFTRPVRTPAGRTRRSSAPRMQRRLERSRHDWRLDRGRLPASRMALPARRVLPPQPADRSVEIRTEGECIPATVALRLRQMRDEGAEALPAL